MSLIKNKDSRAELAVRRLAHALGFRFRLHVKRLPGRPDLVFPRHRKIILVHGCFWHRHHGCSRTRYPKSPESAAFWREKLDANAARDAKTVAALTEAGWNVLVVWECQTENPRGLRAILTEFLGAESSAKRETSEAARRRRRSSSSA
ncbi:MAG: DNA mismatch endonuclease Vsr [Salinibacterium sp.]|nr:DNA mismatch endonuclease Vsr [Salinibacterium sp.]